MAYTRVCVITSVHHAFDIRIFHKECQALAQAGYDVTLIAQHDRNEVVNGIKIIPLPRLRNRIERMTKTAFLAYLKAIEVDADIYHYHDPELLAIGCLLKLGGKKIIYDMHENLPKQILNKNWVNPKLRRILSLLVRSAERFLLIGTTVIFAEHSYQKDYPWINNYEILLNMPLAGQLLSFKYSAPEKPNATIGYIGGVSTERGSFTTIEALKIIKDSGINPRFECVGPIIENHKNDLMKKCEEYNLHQVVFHGELMPPEGWRVIAKCNVGLALLHPIPNYYESYPTKIFEYMAMGIPVVASSFPLYRQVIESNHCGLCVDPLDPKAIAGAVSWILEHPTESEAMGRCGRKAVEQIYNWNVESKKLISLYDKLSVG